MNLKMVGVAGLVLAVSAVYAAPDAFDKYAANIGILQIKEVQTELKISEAQRGKLNKHAAWLDGERKKLNAKVDPKKGPSEADQKKASALLNQFKDKIVAELSAVQLKRLRELSLQQMGHTALLDETVSKKVGISQTQLTKLRTAYESMISKVNKLQEEAFKPINEKYSKKQGKTDAEKKKIQNEYLAEVQAAEKKIQPTLQKHAAQYKATLDQTLLADQKKKWSALQGKPFSIKK